MYVIQKKKNKQKEWHPATKPLKKIIKKVCTQKYMKFVSLHSMRHYRFPKSISAENTS
jgi:hypothetical protein